MSVNYINDYRFLFSDLSNGDYFFDSKMHGMTMEIELLYSYYDEENIRNGDYIHWEADIDFGFDNGQTQYRLKSGNLSHSFGYWGDYISDLDSDYAKDLEAQAIQEQLMQYALTKKQVNEEPGLYYFVSDGQRVLSNLPPDLQNTDFFRSQPVYLIQEGWAVEISHSSNTSWGSLSSIGDASAYVAYSHEVVEQQNAQWKGVQRELNLRFAIMAASVLAALIMLAILLAGAGRRYGGESGGVHFTALDRPWLDAGFVVLLLVETGILILFVDYTETALRYGNIRWAATFCAIFAVCFILLALWWLTSLVKRCKAGRWWRHTLLYWLYDVLWGFLCSLWSGLIPTAKALLTALGLLISMFLLCLMEFTMEALILFLAVSVVETVVLLRYARRLNILKRGAEMVAAGRYDRPVAVTGGELGNIADSINSISEGINAAVAQRMKSERFKTELITNVSHDIRTPLTSLITYTDLLKTEGLDSDKAPEYLEVLIQKSARLKALTDDLFEASKAASGSIDVRLEALDLADFMRQVLGEMDERIQKSGLDFRLSLPEHAPVTADGKLLWRVMENLLSNALKYALAASRVYIDIVAEGGEWRLELKNISAYPLNIDPSELTERFIRGDSARTDEGSGLGLSIAQSFIQAQQGQFAISIDGDLFKATIRLPKRGDITSGPVS